MNIALLLGVLIVLLFLGTFTVAYALAAGSDLAKRLHRETRADTAAGTGWRAYLRRSVDLMRPLGEVIPRSPEEMSRQERRLTKAGIRRKDGAVLLYGAKLSAAIVFLFAFTATGQIRANPLLYIALPVLLGALLPDLWLTWRIARRNDRIQLALPNALDLTVVCVEAGMGLDQALMRIGQEMDKGFHELSDELRVLSLEIGAGRKRADALRNLGNRTNNKDVKALVAVLIQTDRFGTSIAQSLRVFSESMRTTRRLRAEEHAAKMSIKMIPALVLFIFPAMVIVTLFPTIIAIIRELLPALAGN